MSAAGAGTQAPRLAGAVPEAPFWIEVNGRRLAVWSCSPGHPDALALGWLLAEGYLEPGDRLPALAVVESDAATGVRIDLPAGRVARADAERAHRHAHGCGLAHFSRCEPGRLRAPRRAPLPPDADFPALFQALFSADDGRRDPGGTHAAALSDGTALRHRVEEVGRHNAVDKTIGRALLAGDDLARYGLVLTARVSGEIALKAARAGIGWIASRSVPTTLALEIAGAAGVPVLARAAGRSPRLHLPPTLPDAAP